MPRSLLLVSLLLLAPLAAAAAPSPMSVAGALTVNGAPAEAGTRLIVAGTGGAPLVDVLVGSGGTFQAFVPADDPATPAREGGVEGEALEFFAAGARAVGANVEYRAGQQSRGLALAAQAADLVLLDATASPREVPEGDNVTLTGAVANRGRAAASVSVLVEEGGETLAHVVVGEVPVNATRPFSVEVPTNARAGNVSLLVSVAGDDASAANDRVVVPIAVLPRGAPVVTAFARLPDAPRPGDNVILLLNATDDDGIARVVFHWDDGSGERTELVAAPPYQAAIGVFPEGARVRAWAVVTDASTEARSTTTPVQLFLVRSPAATSPAPSAPVATSPVTSTVDAATPTPETTHEDPLPGSVAILALGVAGVLLYARRRRT